MGSRPVSDLHTYFVAATRSDAPILVHNANYPRDFATRDTNNWGGLFNSEREARNLARRKVGRNPVEVEPFKYRSVDGKWQYRAKPGDLADGHIHLEELDPATGEVLQNLHLRWPLEEIEQ